MVEPARIDDLPVAARELVDLALRHRLAGEDRLPHGIRVAFGILRSQRVRERVYLNDAVGSTVDVEVKSGAEEVLMIRGEQAWLELGS